jgi:glycerophosphoryl diester phosphodiesterase
MAACRRLQLPVIPWTVDDASQARSLVRVGVTGLFTNDPAELRWRAPVVGL